MNIIDLQIAKGFLNVFHDSDDVNLQILLNAAESEALDFMNRLTYEDWRDSNDCLDVPGSVRMGVLLLLQANYQASTDDAAKLRAAAEIKLQPHRICIGV